MRLTGRLFALLGLLVFAAVVVAATAIPAVAGQALPPTVRPVIAKPTSAPVTPTAGQPFAVSFRVTRSDNRKPLTSGTMIADTLVDGKRVPHTDSFRGGTARVSFVLPKGATV